MMGSEWLYGAIALLVGLHVLTMLYAYRRQSDPASGATQSDPETTPPAPSDDAVETIDCAHCGATNERGYQFCRECVADLSSGAPQRQSVEHSQPY
ncbi:MULTISPECIES: DUF7577 domain-containing protein [Haloarcula]|uniref:DUF7577 domain-containing protein n=1 Tax=Haloarcula pellucida TaxID=1427151 RepID=A0A830GQS4_9EURY|nr:MULTISPECIES: zinc ribbon domain-containing protein [Halomicroarcula]MBX0350040.1 zinc ribbon domain-containing protein [Halomicroarcula pellucida]MDS0277856.1 zinc ribbon domain-containing protein [Halomicroarcula sp. S1AR25-4]GGO00128.1 hypothetical protein GCM10009030_32420 [Halomicroarcula pellucida]